MIWIILIFGLILRLISIGQSFWIDEATSATVVRDLSFNDILTSFAPSDFHPPFYYLTLKVWTILFGVSEISTRFLSLLFGLGTIYVVYLIGLTLWKKSDVVAILAALLVASAPLHIYYSQEARMYSMATLLVCLSVLFFVKTIKAKPRETKRKQGRAGYWLAFAATLSLLGMTDYIALLILPAFWIYGIYSKQPKSWWDKFIASHIILVASYVWWWPQFSQQFSGGLGVSTSLPGWWNILGKTSLKEIFLVPVKFMIGRIGFDNKLLYGLLIVPVGCLFGYLSLKGIKNVLAQKKTILWLGLWILVPAVATALIGLIIPVFSYFRLLFVLPAFYLIVAIGLSKVKEKWFPLFLIAVLVINLSFSGLYLSNLKFHREDWRGLAAFVNDESKDKKYAVIFPSDGQQEGFKYYGGEVTKLDSVDNTFGIVWLPRYVVSVVDPSDSARTRIESIGYNKTLEKSFNGLVIWKYEKSD